jgi:hypothetical protein
MPVQSPVEAKGQSFVNGAIMLTVILCPEPKNITRMQGVGRPLSQIST